MNSKTFWAVLVIAAAAVGGGYYYLNEQGMSAAPAANAANATTEKVVTVEAEKVTVGPVVEDIRAVGTLQPNEAVIISSEIAGRVEKIRFDESENVAAGDALVELDDSILRAELTKVNSDLTLAKTNLERANKLASQGTGTLRARDEAVAANQAAEANLALARARLEKAMIKAPFSGVVGLRSVSIGAYVTPGDHLVQLVNIDPIKVDFRVPELSLSSLHPGQAIRVTVDARPGRTFDGEIYVIDPIVDENGRAVRLRARIPNPDQILFPGLFARVQIIVNRRENSVIVPESAIFARDRKHYVYTVVDSRTVLTEIELGQRLSGLAEVTKGLDGEAVVVTAGHQQVNNGTRVEIIKLGADS
ncbi:MAG: efflux transporter periplasmic adaptor subunit [Sneathiella sp.]|uniref:efflux RND transporter periplasmic adaptor subunit n=1 Tax=Sneathiella sp. TaxID=1964365 RepID=UPI000C3E5672|nr:efflux RND transporter periplasmic adaptor subunit [Sneathiella sp.]MAZ04453.1 efflux transporter periplasmic adaptor subunit [Sneathiella sp.]